MRLLLSILLSTVLLAAGCKSSRKTAQLPEVQVNAKDNEYRAMATMAWDITHTEVSVSFDFTNRTATGSAQIDMHPYFYASDKIVLDAKSMKINKVDVNGATAKINYANDSLTVYLDREYHKTENLRLNIDYIAQPYATPTGGSKAINSDRGLFFINTDKSIPYKPVQIWTQGETEATSHWVPTFDKPNERFTTRVHITVPDSMVTLSNGQFAGSVTDDVGTRTDTWVMDKDIQPYVMMMAIGHYKIVADKQWRGKEVNYYVEPEYEAYAKHIFKHTPEMIEFFSNVTGVPYPWHKYSQVVVRDYVSGAMENTSATIFGEFMNKTSRELADDDEEDIVSHELFHQWFGDYVTAESWSNLTLNESFATYGEQLWRMYKYGKADAERLAHSDFMTYLNQTAQNDEPLVRFHYKSREDMFDRISYQKGATILHYMHGLMGDSAFYESMKLYLTQNALQPAEAHQWRMAVEKVTGKDWNWFFNQWYFRGGHPLLDVKYEFNDAKKEVKIAFAQAQAKTYILPFNILIAGNSASRAERVQMEDRNMTVTYPYPNGEKPSVYIDRDNWIVGTITDNKTTAHWLSSFKMAGTEDYGQKMRILQATAAKTDNTEIRELHKLAMKDNLEYIRTQAVYNLFAMKNKALRTEMIPLVQALAQKDTSRHAKAAALQLLAAWEVKEAKADMYSALNNESYKVMAAGLKGLQSLKEDTAYTIAKKLLPESGGDLKGAIWGVIAGKGKAEDTTLILDQKYRLGGGKKLVFANSMAQYMKNTKDDKAFTAALQTVAYHATSEGIGGYRNVMMSFLFDVAYYNKEIAKGSNKKPEVEYANKRLNELKNKLTEMRKQETDEENLRKYARYMKDVYGKE